MHDVFLSVGGNLGNKQHNLQKVRMYISRRIGELTGQSSVYETPPWGFFAEEDFWNQVLQVRTALSPENVLREAHEIEQLFGRKQDAGYYMSREMDIDILYYDSDTISTDELIIPHPRIPERLFVLVPLVELAPGYVHPVHKRTNRQLLDQCSDKSAITRIEL